ncbi:MAG: DUF4197 domain-containing protein [Gammaproteobacteria bacterium]|nr:DUF4197 domain-containing protein [Gammaproteobacteria bacterium]MCW9030498.1 DUF4197 domain-containing protein [Gammaproteobacteria bacterium]
MRLKTAYQFFILFLSFSLLPACAINDKHQLDKILESGRNRLNNINKKPLSEQDIASGLKEALKVGTERVINQVGKNNGYLNDKAIHIALPSNLQKVHNTLNQVGLGHYTKELEVKMNHAAEVAATKAKDLFWVAIKDMRWQDVQTIYNGKQDAATQYFRKKMTPSLKQMMHPVINQSLSEVGAVKAYNHAVKQYHQIPFVPRVNDDLAGYVMDKGINGMFYYLAKEEAAIRNDPLKRTTAILKRVFEK